MNIYISGIGGTGLCPLANLALDGDCKVFGSDMENNLEIVKLKKRGAKVTLKQSGEFLKKINKSNKLEWFIYTSALSKDHPELLMAKKLKLKISKRDEFLNNLIKTNKLDLISIAGTHGKTGSTSLMVWLFKYFKIPVSYSIGSDLSWASSSAIDKKSEYFIYECDEFDKNFLKFDPVYSIITSIDHDHFDTYPTEKEYYDSFSQYVNKESHKQVMAWKKDLLKLNIISKNVKKCKNVKIANFINVKGKNIRENSYLVLETFKNIFPDIEKSKIQEAIQNFPGANRRMEKLAKNIYTDYAHHPKEIISVLSCAKEINSDITVVYQPHQNIRQKYIIKDYTDCFNDARNVYWLKTYLSREDGSKILKPKDLTKNLDNRNILYPKMDDGLKTKLHKNLEDGSLVLFLGAGDIDLWAREFIKSI